MKLLPGINSWTLTLGQRFSDRWSLRAGKSAFFLVFFLRKKIDVASSSASMLVRAFRNNKRMAASWPGFTDYKRLRIDSLDVGHQR